MIAIVLLAKDIATIITQQSNTPNNTNPTIKQSLTTGCASLQLTILILNHFKTVEDMGLTITASWSSAYKISRTSTERFKSY
jgi:hypothetical protein